MLLSTSRISFSQENDGQPCFLSVINTYAISEVFGAQVGTSLPTVRSLLGLGGWSTVFLIGNQYASLNLKSSLYFEFLYTGNIDGTEEKLI